MAGSHKNAKTAGNSVVRCESLGRGQRRCGGNQVGEARQEAATRHGETVFGDRLRIPPVAERQPVQQDLFDRRGPRAPRMVQAQRARTTQQMCHAGLVQRRRELAIGRPAIADQHAVIRRIEDRGASSKLRPGRMA
jgi:hypothetical protein